MMYQRGERLRGAVSLPGSDVLPASNLPHVAEDADVVEVSAAAMVLLVTVTVGIGWQGAFYRGGQLALAAGLTVTGAAALAARRLDASELRWPLPMAVVSLGGWSVIGGLVHGAPGPGLRRFALSLAVALTLVVVRRLSSADRRALVAALPVIGASAALVGWAGLVLRLPAWSQQAQGLWRAAGTLTYSNAAAAVLAPLALVAIADLARSDRTPGAAGRRLVPVAGTRLLATVMVAGVLATLSRGGVLALLVGLIVLVVLGRRAALVAAVGPLAGAAVVFAGLVPSLPADRDPQLAVAVGGLVAGMIVAHLAGSFLEREAGAAGWLRRSAAVGGCLLVALLATGLGSRLEAIAEVRLGSGSNYRAQAADAAASLWARNPVLGTGPGGAVATWQAESGASVTLRYLHNEYLQVLVEGGVIGGLLLLAVVVAGVRAARPWDRAPAGTRFETRPGVGRAGGVAAMAAFAVVSAVDIPWHLPVLPVLMATVFALTLTEPRFT